MESYLQTIVRRMASKSVLRYQAAPVQETADLAALYAEHWNALAAAGLEPTQEGLWKAEEELSAGGAVLYFDEDTERWDVAHAADFSSSTAIRNNRAGMALRYGWSEYTGKPRGKDKKVARGWKNDATGEIRYQVKKPEDQSGRKSVLKTGGTPSKKTPAQREDERKATGFNEQSLRDKLAPHADLEMTGEDKKKARRAFGTLLRKHGDLVLHRLDELASEAHEALQDARGDEQQALKQKLRQLHEMAGWAKEQTAKTGPGNLVVQELRTGAKTIIPEKPDKTLQAGDWVTYTDHNGKPQHGKIEAVITKGRIIPGAGPQPTTKEYMIVDADGHYLPSPAENVTPEPAEVPKDRLPAVSLAKRLAKRLAAGDTIKADELFAAANDAFGGTRAEAAYGPSEAYDALESGFNQALANHTDPTSDLESAKAQAETLAERVDQLPTQTNRSGNKDAFQQFSTPPHYAFAVNWLANIGNSDVVLEPSAGTGCLATHAANAGAAVFVNELDPKRAEFLKHQFGSSQVTQENAEQIGAILPKKGINPSVVVMNPPFSQTAGRLGDKKDLMTGANHITQALQVLAPGGRLVAIVGGGVSRDGERKAGMAPDAAKYKDWFHKLAADGYDLRANVGVSGDVYKKYGTAFGTRVLVIDKTGGSKSGKIVTGDVESIPELMTLLEGVRNDRPRADRAASGDGDGDRVPDADESAASAAGQPADAARAGVSGKPGRGSGAAGGRSQGGSKPPDDRGPGSGSADAERGLRGSPAGTQGSAAGPKAGSAAGKPRSTQGSDGPAGKPRRGGADAGGQPHVRDRASVQLRPAAPVKLLPPKGPSDEKKPEQTSESLYASYEPAMARVEGSCRHPASLVETAAMAAIKPPVAKYQPTLSPDVIEQGRLSDAALETIVYAGQAHEQMLPAAEGEPAMRRGFFLGDGTGAGKGRQCAGLMMDNWNQGRKKHVWISMKQNLLEDAQRDWQDIGMNDLGAELFHFDRIRKSKTPPPAEGACFITYDTLKTQEKKTANNPEPKRNLDRLVEWLGEDFDGCIVFDEAHAMANATATKGARGGKKPSMRAVTGIELQMRLPKARIMYVSATGATEVTNLAYAERLGIWGTDTPFPDKQSFIAEMDKGGVAAMEAVAQSLKATGSYIARSLSLNDGTANGQVTYERLTHQLTPDQREMYNALADGWQVVLQNIDKALELCGGSDSPQAKSAARSQFWGNQQRFFNQVMTAMQTASVINGIEEDLKQERAPVVQVVNTMEAATKRALALKESEEDDDYEEMDISPRQILMQFLEHSFPTRRMEEYKDEATGAIMIREVKDADGHAVEDPQAVKLRNEMLDMAGALRIPESPLDQIINHFGQDTVAECTGRTIRMTYQKAADGKTKLLPEKRNATSANSADAEAFQAGRKKILVFSDAGGTGRSYHADKRAKNQAQRVHYVLQPGWRADNAVQGLGRTHRTNQASAPVYRLVEIDALKAQKRFISTIARRLDQLGALTRGQRQAGSSGLFKAADNFESREANQALVRFVEDLRAGKIKDLPYQETMRQLGIDEKKEKKEMPIDGMAQFMNRLLSLRVETQALVFDEYDKRLQDTIEAAMAAGTLDLGVENFPAESIERKTDAVVHREPSTGAEVKHIVVNAKQKTEKREWKQNAKGELPLGYVQNHRSGRVFAKYKMTDGMDRKTGQVFSRYALRPAVGGAQFPPTHEVDYHGRFKELDESVAKDLWEKQYAEAPDTYDSEEHFVAGSLLPVWDRIPGDQPKIYRLKMADGQTIVGRHVPKDDVLDMMKNFGVAQARASEKFDVRETHEQLAKGAAESVRLANGWKLKPVRVQGERRIELIGPSVSSFDELEKNGVIKERIQYQTRLFVPVGEAGAGILERITANRPIVEADMARYNRPGTPIRYESPYAYSTGEESSDPFQHLAEMYAAFWNDLERAGMEPSDQGVWKVAEELAGGDWVLYHDPDDDQWKVIHEGEAPKAFRYARERMLVYRCPWCGGLAYAGEPVRGGVFQGNALCSRCGHGFSILGHDALKSGAYRYAAGVGILRYAAHRVPKGYVVNKGGKIYRAGTWVSEADLRSAVPVQQGAKQAKKTATKPTESSGTAKRTVNRDDLKQKLAAHGHHELTADEVKAAKRRFAGLSGHHKEAVHHRLEELINSTHEALQHVKDEEARGRLSRQMRAYQEMLGWGDAKATAGKTYADTIGEKAKAARPYTAAVKEKQANVKKGPYQASIEAPKEPDGDLSQVIDPRLGPVTDAASAARAYALLDRGPRMRGKYAAHVQAARLKSAYPGIEKEADKIVAEGEKFSPVSTAGLAKPMTLKQLVGSGKSGMLGRYTDIPVNLAKQTDWTSDMVMMFKMMPKDKEQLSALPSNESARVPPIEQVIQSASKNDVPVEVAGFRDSPFHDAEKGPKYAVRDPRGNMTVLDARRWETIKARHPYASAFIGKDRRTIAFKDAEGRVVGVLATMDGKPAFKSEGKSASYAKQVEKKQKATAYATDVKNKVASAKEKAASPYASVIKEKQEKAPASNTDAPSPSPGPKPAASQEAPAMKQDAFDTALSSISALTPEQLDRLADAVHKAKAGSKPDENDGSKPASSHAQPIALPEFASSVQKLAATRPPEERYYDNKVFIAPLWKATQEDPKFPRMTLPEFKKRLIEANAEGLLRLSRADLVQEMDPQLVKESEANHLTASFHFVLLQ